MADKRGLAILVTCDYHGELPQTKRDAEKMREMFEQFEYDIHQLMGKDATNSNIEQLLKQVKNHLKGYNGAAINRDGNDKVIIFAFSGHGTEDNQIQANDRELLHLHDIVRPLVNSESPLVKPIPKLFFIDACRGRVRDDMTGAIEGNYCIEFATLQNHQAAALAAESEWMPVLAQKLRRYNDTYVNVIERVKKQISDEGLQQAQTINSLTTAGLKLHYYSGYKGMYYYVCYPCVYIHLHACHGCRPGDLECQAGIFLETKSNRANLD